MDSAADRRAKLRIVVGPDVTIKFRVNQIPYQGVRITNLSSGGCFATLPRSDNHVFHQGSLLEAFQFENASLAGDPFLAKVAYVLGGQAGGRGGMPLIGLGIHFVSMTPSMDEMLKQYIDAKS